MSVGVNWEKLTMDLAALKTELTTDPLARGYSAMGDEAAANSLNMPGRDIARDGIDTGTIAASIVVSEFAALTQPQRDYITALIAAQNLPWTANVKTQLGLVFGAGTQTRTNLIALQKRVGTRGEELGLGTVTPSNVADARRLP